YAIAIEDPNNEWDVQIFQQTSASTNWPKATATVGSGYVLTGGGAQANWQDNGNFLTASYPDLPANATTATSWVASSKDHFVADVSTITAYAIGMKSTKGIPLTTKIFTKVSASAALPSTSALVDSGYTLVGGGAKVNWEGGLGNLLIKSFLGDGGWK